MDRAGPAIALDVSRLLSRAGRETATGIDRVELAYAQRLLGAGRPVHGAAFAGPRGIGPAAPRQAAEFAAGLAALWRGEVAAPAALHRLKLLALRLRLGAWQGGARALAARLRGGRAPVYLLVSHHHLERRGAIARLKAAAGARFVCLIHDLIPVQYPEYAKPGQAAHHLRRIETAAALADALIVNSAVTREALLPHLEQAGRRPPVVVAPFGTDLPPAPRDDGPPPAQPYFVYVSTIEARKNHILLLNLWRDLAERLGPSAPRLVLVGQRGWETENVVDMLERCPGLREVVSEFNTLPDADMVRLLRGARALLLPSFAEGFGFPLAEGLALGVPALCSDIPALRETGGDVPEYFHPLDGLGWRDAVLDYARPQAPRRDAQLARLAQWRPASWDDHFAAFERLLEEL
jgi:glycosyltransferase involved in cell wall biosynthesis